MRAARTAASNAAIAPNRQKDRRGNSQRYWIGRRHAEQLRRQQTTCGARLMLAMLERCVTDCGGTYAFCDTDSMAIVATERGGLHECNGGAPDELNRSELIRALTWTDVRAIQARFNAINPYDAAIIPNVLNIEDVNFRDAAQRTLFAYVVSAKRYALYSRQHGGSIRLEKCSEHGLGQLLNPLPKGSGEKWPDLLWKIILHDALKLPFVEPTCLEFPAVSRVSVSTPKYFRGFLRGWADKEYAARIKPFGFLISVQVARFGHPEMVDPKQFHLLAPFTPTPEEWAQPPWTDTYSGQQFAITTSLSCQTGVVRVRSIRDVLGEFLGHGEMKSANANGEAAGAGSRGLLFRRHVAPSELRLIGKESNAIEAAEAGMISDWAAILSTYGDRLSTNAPTLELLMTAPAATLAQAWNVSIRTVRAWRRKQRHVHLAASVPGTV